MRDAQDKAPGADSDAGQAHPPRREFGGGGSYGHDAVLSDVAETIRTCSDEERAKLARFLTVQAEENLGERPGASRILLWLGVVAAGREPNRLDLADIPAAEREYVVELARRLEGIVREQAALDSVSTPADLEDPAPNDDVTDPVAEVWRHLADTVHRSLVN
ncbi:MAG: hypothetical protein ACLFWM_07790 [Actinomycetota bacterium]